MCTEDRWNKELLEELVREKKIQSFRMDWTSGKFVVRREKLRQSINNASDIEKYKDMEPIEEKRRFSTMNENCSYDM